MRNFCIKMNNDYRDGYGDDDDGDGDVAAALQQVDHLEWEKLITFSTVLTMGKLAECSFSVDSS